MLHPVSKAVFTRAGKSLASVQAFNGPGPLEMVLSLVNGDMAGAAILSPFYKG